MVQIIDSKPVGQIEFMGFQPLGVFRERHPLCLVGQGIMHQEPLAKGGSQRIDDLDIPLGLSLIHI